MLASTVGALLRRSRRLPAASCRWLGTRLPLAEGEDPFDILGISVDTEETEIKARFYAKAKILHPDVCSRAGRDTKAEFSRLVRSYEVLMDRNLRAEYLLRRRGRGGAAGTDNSGRTGTGAAPWAGRSAARRSSPVEEFNASIRRGRRAKAQRGQRYYEEEMAAEAEAAAEWRRRQQRAAESTTGMTPGTDDWDLERALAMLDGGLLGQLQQEYDEALLFAYLGPRVEERTIPWAFECEERRPIDYEAAAGSDTDGGVGTAQLSAGVLHPHILQITSGQQLLGFVEARADGGWSPFLPEGPPREQQQQDEPALRSPFSGLRSVEGRHNYAPLALTWQGAPLAEAVRLRNEQKGEDVIVVKVLQRAVQGEVKGGLTVEGQGDEAPCYLVRGLDTSAIVSQHVVEDVRTGRPTHLMICHKTPLVKHMHILQVADRRVEVKISRGWRPPSDLWRFPPRSPDHDIGGFYIERAEAEGERRRAMLLHPAVYIVSSAYKTLDREEEERRKAQARAGGAAPRIAAMARTLVEKFM